MRKNYLVFGSPQIEEDDIQEVVDTLRSGWIGSGPRVARFEEEFRQYKGSKYACAVNSCTAALHLAMLVSGIGPGDEVITTPLTFCATVNAILHTGATPVLADVDPESMNIDPALVAEKITARTKAILPVHFAGRPCDMDGLMRLAGERDLIVVEDCAHAIEALYRGRHVGTFGDFGCFSFYVTKNLVTGEGGMVLTESLENSRQVKMMALHGMSSDAWKRFSDDGYKHYFVAKPGFKYNMMDIQAALGIRQLARLEKNLVLREKVWAAYDEAFADLPVVRPSPVEQNTRHARHLYTLLLTDEAPVSRDVFLQRLHTMNIGTGVHYLSLPEHDYYQQTFGWRPEDYPAAMHIGRRTASLPLSAKLTDQDVSDVIDAVRSILTA